MSPKISIIMGVYNCEKTLSEAIDSILAQTIEDWEFIICDDGSADSSFEIISSYAMRFPGKIIPLQNHQNMGLNYTLNKCLKHAGGEYVARMDGDDISLPIRFEKELAYLETHPEIAVVSCPMIYFDENGEWGRGNSKGKEDPVPEQLIHGTVHCHAPCMVRRDIMQSVGGYTVDRKLLRVEDWHLWVKIYSAGWKGHNLSEPLYMMRDDKNAGKRRKFRYRINEAYVISLAVYKFHLPIYKYLYCLRPIIVGLLPASVYQLLHKKRLDNYS